MSNRTSIARLRLLGWLLFSLAVLPGRPALSQIDFPVVVPTPTPTSSPQPVATYNPIPPSQPLLAIDDKTYQYTVPIRGLVLNKLSVKEIEQLRASAPPRQIFTLGGLIQGNGNDTLGAARLVYSSGVSQFDVSATRLFGPVEGLHVGGTLLISSSRQRYAGLLEELRGYFQNRLTHPERVFKEPTLPKAGLAQSYEDSITRPRYAMRASYTRLNGLGDVTCLGLTASHLHVLDRDLKAQATEKRDATQHSGAIGGLIDIAALNANPKLAGSTWSPDWLVTVYWQDRAPLAHNSVNALGTGITRIDRWRFRVGATYRGDNHIVNGDSIMGFVRLHDARRYLDYTLSGGRGSDGRAIVGLGIDIGIR